MNWGFPVAWLSIKPTTSNVDLYIMGTMLLGTVWCVQLNTRHKLYCLLTYDMTIPDLSAGRSSMTQSTPAKTVKTTCKQASSLQRFFSEPTSVPSSSALPQCSWLASLLECYANTGVVVPHIPGPVFLVKCLQLVPPLIFLDSNFLLFDTFY